MNYSFFIGIDISKEWFDAAIIAVVKPSEKKHQRFQNNPQGFKAFFKWLKQNRAKNLSTLFVCMEHTGVYTIPLCEFLDKKKITYTLVPGAEIKNSLGITRGKNDIIDANKEQVRSDSQSYQGRFCDEVHVQNTPNSAVNLILTKH